MKCENDEQYEAAMLALISGSSGAVRDALTAIHDYLGKRPSDIHVTFKTPVKVDEGAE
jgi:hypothetical protein